MSQGKNSCKNSYMTLSIEITHMFYQTAVLKVNGNMVTPFFSPGDFINQMIHCRLYYHETIVQVEINICKIDAHCNTRICIRFEFKVHVNNVTNKSFYISKEDYSYRELSLI